MLVKLSVEFVFLVECHRPGLDNVNFSGKVEPSQLSVARNKGRITSEKRGTRNSSIESAC